MQAQKAEGTRDLIGAEMRAWQKMQQIAASVFEPFGFKPIETPAIEQVDVFVHGIGQSTDVVRKEMFRVFSGANLERVFTEGTDTKLKPKQRLALRPEGTAGVVRAVVENNLVPQGSTPFKAYYAEAMFRGERPQKGRLRQFHQVGVEWLGAPDPAADAECIIMLMEFYKRLGFDLSKLRLLINSMGDAQCRPAYREQVKQFILDHADEMCDECRERKKKLWCFRPVDAVKLRADLIRVARQTKGFCGRDGLVHATRHQRVALVAEVGQKLVFDERSRLFPPQLLSRGAGKLGKGFRQSQGRRPLSARDRPQW